MALTIFDIVLSISISSNLWIHRTSSSLLALSSYHGSRSAPSTSA